MKNEASSPRPKHAAPRRGRPRVVDAKTSSISVRCTATERTTIDETAAQAGLSVGAYLRALALGKPGPRARRRPPIEREKLAQLLGHLGKIGSNINQLAHAYNGKGRVPALAELAVIKEEIAHIRSAIMTALGHDH